MKIFIANTIISFLLFLSFEIDLLATIKWHQYHMISSAAYNGEILKLRMLFMLGYSPSLSANPAIVMAVSGRQAETVRYLLNEHHDPNVSDKYGNTALEIAIYQGSVEIAEMLLSNDVRFDGHLNANALPYAIARCQPELAYRLLEKGARLTKYSGASCPALKQFLNSQT